jgi:hypothetical protein
VPGQAITPTSADFITRTRTETARVRDKGKRKQIRTDDLLP